MALRYHQRGQIYFKSLQSKEIGRPAGRHLRVFDGHEGVVQMLDGVQADDGPPEAADGRGRRVRRLLGRADGRQAQAVRAPRPLRGVLAARRRVPRLSRADRGAAGDGVKVCDKCTS